MIIDKYLFMFFHPSTHHVSPGRVQLTVFTEAHNAWCSPTHHRMDIDCLKPASFFMAPFFDVCLLVFAESWEIRKRWTNRYLGGWEKDTWKWPVSSFAHFLEKKGLPGIFQGSSGWADVHPGGQPGVRTALDKHFQNGKLIFETSKPLSFVRSADAAHFNLHLNAAFEKWSDQLSFFYNMDISHHLLNLPLENKALKTNHMLNALSKGICLVLSLFSISMRGCSINVWNAILRLPSAPKLLSSPTVLYLSHSSMCLCLLEWLCQPQSCGCFLEWSWLLWSRA